VRLCQKALAKPEQSWPTPLPPPLTIEQNNQIKKLRQPLAEFARQHDMAQELLVRKKVLQDLVTSQQLPDSLHGWRREQLGQLLLAQLNP